MLCRGNISPMPLSQENNTSDKSESSFPWHQSTDTTLLKLTTVKCAWLKCEYPVLVLLDLSTNLETTDHARSTDSSTVLLSNGFHTCLQILQNCLIAAKASPTTAKLTMCCSAFAVKPKNLNHVSCLCDYYTIDFIQSEQTWGSCVCLYSFSKEVSHSISQHSNKYL